jgi:hypothetical protein
LGLPIFRTLGDIIFSPRANSASVGINGAIGTSDFVINNGTHLSSIISANKLILGNSTSGTGAVTIGSGWNISGYTYPVEVYGGSVNTGSITAGNNTLLLRAQVGNIALNSGAALSSTASGNAVVLAAAGNFINNSGSATPITVTGGGRYLVYSSSPLTDDYGVSGTTRPNKRYNFTYGTSTAGLFSGASGFLYSVAPTITVTATAQSKVYGEINPSLTYSVGGLIDGDTAGTTLTGSLTTTATQYSNVGSYGITQGTVTLTTAASTLGYTFSGYTPANLSITPRPVTVTVTATANNGLTKIYGNSDPALSYAIANGSVVNGDGFTGALSRTIGENVGNYALNAGTLTLGGNYTLSVDTSGKTLAITPRPITVTADSGLTRIYGYTDPTLSYAITSGNLVNGDGFTGGLLRTTGENVGNYALSAGTLSLGGNYTLSVDTSGKTLAITRRAIMVSPDSGLMKMYGTNDPLLTYKVTSGSLAFSDTFSGGLSRASGDSPRSYAINAGSLNLSSNYDLNVEQGQSFIIVPSSTPAETVSSASTTSRDLLAELNSRTIVCQKRENEKDLRCDTVEGRDNQSKGN